MSNAIVVDASVIVRYLTNDDARQSPEATELFRAASRGELYLIVPTSVLQETVYVLETSYGGTPETIAPKIVSLLALPHVSSPDIRWVLDGIHWYRTKKADFGDALLCAYAHHHGSEVATFDNGMVKKFTEVFASKPAEFLRSGRR